MMKRDRYRIAVAFLFSTALILFFRPGFRLDSYAYYDFTRSILVDGDINYDNERNFSPSPVHFGLRTETGFTNNIFPIGTGVLWLPALSLYHAVSGLLSAREAPLPGTALTDDYFTVVCLSSALYVFFGLLLLYAVLCRFVPRLSAFLAVMFLFFASPLLPFSLILPSFSHGVSFFSVTLFLFLVLKSEKSPNLAILCGLAAGLMVLVRLQNALFLIFLLFHPPGEGAGKKKALPSLLLFSFAFLAVFSAQLLTWKILNGSCVSMHAAGEDMTLLHQWSHPVFFQQLFHLRLGLFSFTPLTLLGIIGMLFAARSHPRIFFPVLIIFLLQLYVNSTKSDWYGVGFYGARRFTSLVPCFAIGFALLLENARRRGKWVYAVLFTAAVFCVLKNLASLVKIEAGLLETSRVSMLSFPEAAGTLFLYIFTPEGWPAFFKGSLLLSSVKYFGVGLCMMAFCLLISLAFSKRRKTAKHPRWPAVLWLSFSLLLTGYLVYARRDSRLIYTVDFRTDRVDGKEAENTIKKRFKKDLGRGDLKGKVPMRKARSGTVLPLVLRENALYPGVREPVRLESGEMIRLSLDQTVESEGLGLTLEVCPDAAHLNRTGFAMVNALLTDGQSLDRKIPLSSPAPSGKKYILVFFRPAVSVRHLSIRNGPDSPAILIYGLSLESPGT